MEFFLVIGIPLIIFVAGIICAFLGEEEEIFFAGFIIAIGWFLISGMIWVMADASQKDITERETKQNTYQEFLDECKAKNGLVSAEDNMCYVNGQPIKLTKGYYVERP